MKIIAIIYLIAAVLSIAAMLPQIKKLIITKNSDEFNLSSWFIWFFSQACGSVYAIALKAPAYIIVSSTWTVFYVIMVVLIIKYQPKKVYPSVQSAIGNNESALINKS